MMLVVVVDVLLLHFRLELKPMGGRWRGLEEVEPSPVISSFSLSRLCRLSLQHSTHQPLKQHCIKGKTKIPRYNMKCGGKTRCYLKNFIKYLVFPLYFVLYHGILNYLWDTESSGSVFLKSNGKVYLVIGSPYKP